MKKILFALLCLGFISANAQTADEVMQKYISNLGGLDAFNKVKTAKMSGTLSVQGSELPITNQIINGRAMRTDVDVMGQSIVNAYIDGKGWKVNPVSPTPDAMDVTGDELVDYKSQSRLASELMDYKALGHKIELKGQESVEGTNAYKILLTNKENGKTSTYFITVSDYSLIKSVRSREFNGQTFEVETYHSDYKAFNGLKFSMSRESKVDGNTIQSVKLDKIELDVPIDEKIFAKQ
jgi:hypothetical protein